MKGRASVLNCLFCCIIVVAVQNQITVINSVLDAGDVNALVRALESPAIGIKNVKAENGRWYLNTLNQARRQKIQVSETTYEQDLTRGFVTRFTVKEILTVLLCGC